MFFCFLSTQFTQVDSGKVAHLGIPVHVRSYLLNHENNLLYLYMNNIGLADHRTRGSFMRF